MGNMSEIMMASIAMGLLLSACSFGIGYLIGVNKGLDEGIYLGQKSGYRQALSRLWK